MFVKPPGETNESAEPQTNRRSLLKGIGAVGVGTLMSSISGCFSEEGAVPEDAEEVQELEVAGYPPSNTQIHETLTLIADEVKKLGFKINYNGLKRERQLEQFYYNNTNYDIASGGYTGRPHRLDPHMLLYKNYHSSQTKDGNYNWTNFQNSEIDSLLDEQARTLDRDERQGIIKEVQKKLMDIPPGEIPIEHNSLINVTNTEDFEGFVQVPGLGLKNIWTWTQVTPKSDKTRLNASVDLEIPWITPLWSNEANLITQRMTHDKLARISPEGLPEPWLAEEWQTSSDNTTITIPLKDGFTFHDGEPVTAEDVKFTFDYLQEQEIPFFSSAVDPIESVEAPDEGTIIIYLTEPFAPIFTLTLARVHILPKHVWSHVPDDVDAEQPWKWSPTESEWGLVGSGPFKFVEWRKGEGIVMEANEDHAIAPPNIDSVFLRAITTASGTTSALKNKNVDFAVRSTAQPSVLENLASDQDHLSFVETPGVGYDEWSMNTAVTPLDRPSVRGAMAAMIPKENIANEIWDGYAIPAHSPTSPVLEFWHNENVKKWPEVTEEEAIQMLEDDGFTVTEDTIYYPPGVTSERNDPDN